MRTELYLALVRAGLGESVDVAGARHLTSTDWSWITASARRHRLGNLLFAGIRQSGLEREIPGAVFQSLESTYYTNLAHTFFLFEHAQSIIKRTRKARRGGAPMLLLKGASFAGWLYPSPALRPMGDLDIMVQG
ncbi:MAG: nucleotidyltransferase family protein, partial [Vicinamibacteria bacterium]